MEFQWSAAGCFCAGIESSYDLELRAAVLKVGPVLLWGESPGRILCPFSLILTCLVSV